MPVPKRLALTIVNRQQILAQLSHPKIQKAVGSDFGLRDRNACPIECLCGAINKEIAKLVADTLARRSSGMFSEDAEGAANQSRKVLTSESLPPQLLWTLERSSSGIKSAMRAASALEGILATDSAKLPSLINPSFRIRCRRQSISRGSGTSMQIFAPSFITRGSDRRIRSAASMDSGVSSRRRPT